MAYNATMSPKERLLQLENEGGYVFHGSPEGDLKVLSPRQGKHVPDLNKPTESILDGKPAVSATPYAELAIFRAIINRKNVSFGHTSGFGTSEDGEKHFSVSSKEVLEVVKEKKGFVYVFDKKEFEPYNRDGVTNNKSMEWRSYAASTPIEIIEVSSNDLPPKNKIKIND